MHNQLKLHITGVVTVFPASRLLYLCRGRHRRRHQHTRLPKMYDIFNNIIRYHLYMKDPHQDDSPVSTNDFAED